MSLFLTAAVDAVALLPAIDIPDLNADFTPAPTKALLTLVNQTLGLCTIIALAAVVVIGVVLAFGGLDSRNKSKGWVALGIAGAAMAVMAGASGFLTFFADIPLF